MAGHLPIPSPPISTPPLYEVSESFCPTKTNVMKFSSMWTIDNFSFHREVMNEFLKSSTFCSGADDLTQWRLMVQLTDFLSVSLLLDECPKREVFAKFKFSIHWGKKKELKGKCDKVCRFVPGKEYWGIDNMIKIDKIMNELIDDKVTIFCEVRAMVEPEDESICIPVTIPEAQLSDDMAKMLDVASFSDVTLCTQGREFQVHKGVLSARSPVFKAMFEHPPHENALNRVDIPDIDHKVLYEMLRFMYTGRVPNLDAMAARLLAAADKFRLVRLKSMCEESLCKTLTVSNVCDLLVLSEQHSAVHVKQHAVHFICRNVSDVMNTPGWKNMVVNQPQPVTAVFDALSTVHEGPPPSPRKKFNWNDLLKTFNSYWNDLDQKYVLLALVIFLWFLYILFS